VLWLERHLDLERDALIGRALAPIAAIGVGVAIAATHGVSPRAFLPNAVAVPLGMLVVFLSRGPARDAHVSDEPGLAAESPRPRVPAPVLVRVPVLVLVGAAVAIAATLVSRDAGLEGVRRWLPLGPLRLNASAALLPGVLLGLASLRGLHEVPARRRVAVTGFVLAAVLAVQLVHLAQPDAGQATVLAVAALPLLLDDSRCPRRLGLPVAAVLLVLAAATWRRPDPLAPLGHVEGIARWALAGGFPWNLALGVSIVGLFVALVVPPRGDAPSPAPGSASVRAAAALALFASIAVSFFGAFPVPIAGAGAAPVLGFYGLLAMVGAADTARKRAPVEPEPRAHR
jgi:hypothetical protein